jgi:hypothetical protein
MDPKMGGPKYVPIPEEVREAFAAMGGEYLPETTTAWPKIEWKDSPAGPVTVVFIDYFGQMTTVQPRIHIHVGGIAIARVTDWRHAALIAAAYVRGERYEQPQQP